MFHLTDADFVLYRQNEAPDRSRVEAHLSTCARCRAELDTLSRVLDLVEEDTGPTRDAAYGLAVWNAIESRLDSAQTTGGIEWPASWRDWLRWCAPPVALAGALAALLIVVFSGRAPIAPAAASDAVLVAAVEDHLERTGLMLTELNNAEDVADVRDVHALAEDLASANRLYRQSAALSGDVHIGRLLDDLERVLLEVAHAPDGPNASASEIETLRGRLDTRGVAFKLRMATTELRARENAVGGD